MATNEDAILLAKAIGLKDIDGKEIFDMKNEPFASGLSKLVWKPSRLHLHEEIMRRYTTTLNASNVFIPPPRFRNWNVAQMHSWLQDNPILDDADVQYIRQQVEEIKLILPYEARSRIKRRLSRQRILELEASDGKLPPHIGAASAQDVQRVYFRNKYEKEAYQKRLAIWAEAAAMNAGMTKEGL